MIGMRYNDLSTRVRGARQSIAISDATLHMVAPIHQQTMHFFDVIFCPANLKLVNYSCLKNRVWALHGALHAVYFPSIAPCFLALLHQTVSLFLLFKMNMNHREEDIVQLRRRCKSAK
jgi:hypothetical protein